MTIELASFEPATAVVACGGQSHTIRWAAGELFADDHGDPEGELALAALGGMSAACLDVLAAWRRLRRDHRLLTCLTRGPGDYVGSGRDDHQPGRPSLGSRRAPGIGRVGARHMGSAGYLAASGTRMTANGWFGYTALGAGPGSPGGQPVAVEVTDDARIETLCRLGGAVPWRLVATVTAALLDQSATGGGPPAAAVPALTASLFGRVRASLATWYGDPDLLLELDVIDPGAEPGIRLGSEESIEVSLPLRWVADVWSRGLAVVGEHFTLAVLDAGPGGVVLDTVGREGSERRRLTLQTG